MRKTGEMREEKGHARDDVKIVYRRSMIRLFSRTIILFLITRENPFVSCIITASTARWFETQDSLRCETRELCLMKQHKKYEITSTHVSHLACFSHLADVSRIICSWFNYVQMEGDLIIYQLTPSKPLYNVSELLHRHSKKKSISFLIKPGVP